ncbi:MAG: 3-oxoacyl-[acyl-carrier-protein] synthase III C-terminal domain-containing protein [Bacteroidales bacterium]
MFQQPVYLSVPAIKLARDKVTNSDIIAKVSNNFKGEAVEFERIKSGINFIFKHCDTKIRYLGLENNKKPVDYAVDVCKQVCHENEIEIDSVGLIIYGGIYREYFEPATAMEIASGIGLKKISAFDVTNACAGLLQSVHLAAALMQTNSGIQNAICCSIDFPEEAINFDIQSFDELSVKSAGLTLGGGASAWLLTRKLTPKGGARIVDFENTSLPNSYNICKVPVADRKFHSESKLIFDLGRENVPVEINFLLDRIGWNITDIEFFITHQPSKRLIYEICRKVGVSIEKAPVIHHLFGNTVNSSIPMAMDYIFKEKKLKPGSKLIFNAAAAGFSMVTGAAVWENK